jgi:integrase
MDWARAAGHASGVKPVEGVEAGLPRQRDRVEHHGALPWAELPALWPRLVAAAGMGALALRFTILTAARSGETRGATWSEVDLEAAVWTVPGLRMKTQREPLSAPSLAILEELRPLAGGKTDALVFPGAQGRPLSDITLAAVLRRLEVSVTVHGFRSTFRDWCEETGSWPHEVKEAALAHVVKNAVERAYRRTDLFDRRRVLMDAWARFVEGEAATMRLVQHG